MSAFKGWTQKDKPMNNTVVGHQGKKVFQGRSNEQCQDKKGLKSILLALAVRLLMTLAREVSVVSRSKLDENGLRNEWEVRK